MVGIRCAHCGQTNDFDLFCQTPMGIPLPSFQYQCPVCQYAFKIEKKKPINTHDLSLPVSDRMPSLNIIPVQGSL